MKAKILMFVFSCTMLISMELMATTIDSDHFISFGNVTSQGLGKNACYYDNVRQYWYDQGANYSTGCSYTGYLLVGGRYMIQQQNISSGFNAGSTAGTLTWTVTDTITGLQATVSQSTLQPFSTQFGAIWTVRANCLSGKTVYEFLTLQSRDVEGISYDLDSYFNFQGQGGNLTPVTPSPTFYTQADGKGGDILGLINIGNITNSNSNWENTDLVAVVANDPHNDVDDCFLYLLNYDTVMAGKYTLGDFWNKGKVTVNAVSGSGTVDQKGNFGALICISFNDKWSPEAYFAPVISNGTKFGSIYSSVTGDL